MISSGMKRGLALSAVSALAFAGLALSPANAQTIDVTQNDPATTGATLYTPMGAGDKISTKVDGNGNTTVTLLATAGKTYGGQTVNTIHFWTPTNLGWLNVHVPVVAGVATFQWTPPANVGAAVQVNAQAEAAGNLAIGTIDNHTVDTTTPNVNESVSIAGANRDKMGLWFNPTASTWTGSVTGKTGTAGAPTVKVAGPGTATTGTTVITSGPDSNGLSGYQSTVTLPGATGNGNLHDVNPFANGSETDDLVVTANNAEDFDGRVFSAYRQIIPAGGATATVRPGSTSNVFGDVPDSYHPVPDGNPANDRTYYNIKVVDQFGKPVLGVPVYESNPSGNAFPAAVGAIVTNFTNGSGNAGSGTTGADGTVQARLDEPTMDIPVIDQDPAAGVQGTYYVVDTNGDSAFTNGTDYLLKITQTNIPAAPATIQLTNDLGLAMDDDETSPFHVKVLDADGNGIANTAVNVTVTQKNLATGQQISAVGQVGVTGPNGVYDTTLNVPNNLDVQTTVQASTTNGTNASIVIESDRSQVLWKPSHLQSAVGTTVEAKGVLRLPDGKTLKGRTIALALATPNATADAKFPTTGQPTGTVAGTPTTATATTQDGGAFSVLLKDGATTGQELNDTITATSPGLQIPGDYPILGDPTYPYPTNIATVDFLRSVTPALVTIHNTQTGTSTSDGLQPGLGVALRPGGLGVGNVQVFNSDNVPLVNTDVALTIDQGNFVNPASPFEATPVPGAPIDFSSAGKTITVSTGDSAKGVFLANIERNTGFDDDGNVADEITAKAGTATDGHDLTWTTNSTPVNPRATNPLVVALSADQESSILPKARAGQGSSGQYVFYDVTTFDQFGNPTMQSINPTDNTPIGFIDQPNGDPFTSQMTLGQPAMEAWAKGATDQAINTELVGATKAVYKDDAATSAFDPSNPSLVINAGIPVDIEANTAAINWYALNFATSTFTLTHDGANTVPAGTQITNILTATDQEGQPIHGLPIGFLRVGPSDDGDSNGDADGETNENGEAFYDWAGNMAGLADVTAVVYNDQGVRQFVVGPDKITFSGETLLNPNLVLKGSSDGNKDVIGVTADPVAGGAVAVVKRAGEVVRTHRLNPNGHWNFRVTDHNGNKVTKYRVLLQETASTRSASARISIK